MKITNVAVVVHAFLYHIFDFIHTLRYTYIVVKNGLWILLALLPAIACGVDNNLVFVPDSGIVVQTDAGVVSCIPNPSCDISDGTSCHIGFQACTADGVLGPCAAYSACPSQKPACTTTDPVNIAYVLQDNLPVQSYQVAQDAAATFTWENPQFNFTYAEIVTPGCTGPFWDTQPDQFLYSVEFLPQITVQCITTNPNANTDNLIARQTQGDIIPWTASQRYIIVFDGSTVISNVQQLSNGVTEIEFGIGQSTFDYMFNTISNTIASCGN